MSTHILHAYGDRIKRLEAERDAQTARIAELEAENERLTRYAATQAESKRAWQQISENTAGEHDETLARVKQLEAALEDFAKHGTRTDLLPTNGHVRDWKWWQDYHARADTYVRERARAALAPGEAGRSSDERH